MPTPTRDFQLPPGRELDRIITLQEAEAISTLVADSWKRETTRTSWCDLVHAVSACGWATRWMLAK